jgi:WD40 repeat protein/class 3 adenylate cyclase
MGNEIISDQPYQELPSGTVTFLFTDIEGSTELLKQLGDEYAAILADQRKIVREVFRRWDGQEVDTQGDSFFVSFPRANQAVAAAAEMQSALANHSWPEDVKVGVRMGLHTGEPLVEEEGYVGIDVHRAARIAQVGHGGQVLLSETTTALILDELPDGVSLLDMGRHLLKDLSRPEHIRQLKIEDLPSEFPPLTSLEMLPAIDLREPRSIGESPYQGLSAFQEDDAEFFFGREGFTDRLIDAVKTHPMVAVIVGSSGSGKSSTVFAGLLPQLRKEGGWSIAQFRPGSQPLTALMSVLIPLIEPDLQTADRLVETRKLADALRSGDLPLHDIVNQAIEKNADLDNLILVVDQFEELYTLCQDEEERGRFKDELLDVVLSGGRQKHFVLLLTMRADFMGQALTHRPFADALQEASLLMGPMTRDELRSAVEKPAEMQGAIFEAGLVERILDDVGEKPGNLPLLEFALTLLWEAQNDGWLAHADYEAIGSVDGALARYADEVYDNFGESDKEQAHRIFIQLVKPGEGTEDTRRVTTRAELADEDWKLVQHLADKRLVVTGRDADENDTVEVVHEALIQRWGQFRRWMQEDRDFRSWQERLRTTLRVWEASNQNIQALLRGLPLNEAENWWAERGNELSAAEEALIQASLAEREQRSEVEEQRQAREDRLERTRRVLSRGLIGVLGIGLVVALGLTYFAFNQRDEAEQSAALALTEADARATAEIEAVQEAESRATAQADAEEQRHAALVQASIGLSSQAALELEGTSPELAVLLALEALENYPYTWQAERALGQAVFENHLRLTLVHDAWINTATWSPDQSQIVTASDDTTAKVWDAVSGELIFTFEHADWVISGVWSPTGDRILTHSGAGEVYVWDAATGNLIQSFNLEGGYALQVAWSPGGDQILIASWDVGNSKVWDVGTGDLLLTLAAGRVCKQGIGMCAQQNEAWSPSGDRILTYDDVGNFQIWDARSGEQLRHVSAHDKRINSVAWFPDGERIVTGSVDSTSKIWSAETGEELVSFEKHEDEVLMASWSPSGDRIVTPGDEDRTARVWDAASGEELVVFDRHNGAVFTAVWSPNGEHILSTGEGGVRLWNASSGEEIQAFFGHAAPPFFAEWSASGEQILTAGPDGTAKIWDVVGGMEILEIPAEAGAYDFLAWSPDGTRIARNFFGEGNPVKVYDAFSGELLLSFPTDHDYEVWTISFSPSGDRIATSTEGDATVKIWDATDGELVTIFEGHEIEGDEERGLPNPRWSPDGTKIVSSGASAIRIWDAVTGEEEMVFEDPQGADQFGGIKINRWSPDGTRIALVSYAYAMIWNAVSGEIEHELFPPDNRVDVHDVSWSPDGTRLAAPADDGLLRIWDTSSGEKLLEVPGNDSLSIEMKWLPSGDRIISGDLSSTIKMFDTFTGAEVFSAQVPKHIFAFLSPDGSRFATLDPTGGPVKIFSIWNSLDELMDIARECCVFRQLTAVEREQFGLPVLDSE